MIRLCLRHTGLDGQRISKTVGDPLNGGYKEYYLRDAQGNIMATYKYANNGTSLKVTDRPVYGSSRIGSFTRQVELMGEPAMHQWPYTQPMQAPLKRYELTDHLGNVAAVVTGRLLPGNGSGASKQAELVSAQGYESFGSLLPGRNYSSDSYRYLFQGQEHDDEINGAVGTSYAFEYRIHDPRIGRFFSIDPLAAKYAYNSPYAFSENRVIDKIELEGLETADPQTGAMSANVYLQRDPQDNVSDNDFNNWFTGFTNDINNTWSNAGQVNGNQVNTSGVNYMQAGPGFNASMLGPNDILLTVGRGGSIAGTNPDQVASQSSFVNPAANTGYMFLSRGGNDGAHEFGHFFGLTDRYHESVQFQGGGGDLLNGLPRMTIPMILPNNRIDPAYNWQTNLYSSPMGGNAITPMQLGIVFGGGAERAYPTVVVINSASVAYQAVRVRDGLLGPSLMGLTSTGSTNSDVEWARSRGLGFNYGGQLGLGERALQTNTWSGNRAANRTLIQQRTR